MCSWFFWCLRGWGAPAAVIQALRFVSLFIWSLCILIPQCLSGMVSTVGLLVWLMRLGSCGCNVLLWLCQPCVHGDLQAWGAWLEKHYVDTYIAGVT